jgi:pseudouridine-5'-phosphate glycosidase
VTQASGIEARLIEAEAALAAADVEGIAGGDVTPFVLSELHRASGGRTVAVNKRLVADNAALAAEVAVAYADV